jgi:hypothetical protein
VTQPADRVSVRYMLEDAEAAVSCYTKVLGFKVLTNLPPAFADVTRGRLRMLLSGPMRLDALTELQRSGA